MGKIAAYTLLFAGLACSPADGQEWGNKMFPVHQHEFGTIARGAKAVFEFPFENIYVQDVHIASASPSCHCTSVSFKDGKQWLKTHEKGAIVASINSGSFLGNRGATITVTFDKPYYAQAQLQVKVFIRSDVVLEPGSVQFGSVDQGAAAERQIEVSLPDGNGVQIVGVKSTSPLISARLFARPGGWGQPLYSLRARLDGAAPPGYLSDHLMLLTNEGPNSQIPIAVEGYVAAGISVSPDWLLLGGLEPGQQVTRQLVVQTRQPLRITRIAAQGPGFSFDLSGEREPKRLHLIPVTFVAGPTPGPLTQNIRIETDRSEIVGTLTAKAVVTEGLVTESQPTPHTATKPTQPSR